MIKKRILFCLAIAATVIISACGGSDDDSTASHSKRENNPNVVLWQLSDPDMLNPVTSQGAGSSVIESQIFQPLLAIDFKSLKLIPVLADSLPIIDETASGMNITYTIRKEAKWDDGSPITAKDVAFSLKVIKCPTVDNPQAKAYYEFINSLKFYPDNPKKLTFVCNTLYILAESSSGGFSIISSKVYDPDNILANYTVKQISDHSDELLKDPKIKKFGKSFNGVKYQRYSESISGSGPYKFINWETGQRIELVKKKDWWGDKLQGTNMYFDNFPPKITYQTINDPTGALVALKNRQLDIMKSIKPKDFQELEQSEKFQRYFNTYTPTQYVYSYLGINAKVPKFSSIKTRQALAHLVDVDKIIKIFSYGYARRIIGPINPNNKKFYDTSITPYTYDREKAQEMLKADGWEDTDGDGTLDKTIDGERVPFTIKFSVNSGNETRKAIALLFQEECRHVGIKVSVVQQDWSIYLQNMKQHKFEMMYGAWVSSPLPSDPKQLFSTKSYNGGSNFVGFGNIRTDKLIDSIRSTIDVDQRARMWKRLQVIMHDQCAYIFLSSPQNTLAISKRFGKIDASSVDPGFWAPSLQLQTKPVATK